MPHPTDSEISSNSTQEIIKLYKFRPLANNEHLLRICRILRSGKFWCSNFWDLNDPMEGVYRHNTPELADKIFSQKSLYKICSFCGRKGFENPLMWGYYANGFRGVCIEVDPCDFSSHNNHAKIEQITYQDNIETFWNCTPNVETILTTKLSFWKQEHEFRFLIKSKDSEHNIGKITAVYVGYPYGNVGNKDQIYRSSSSLQKYESLLRNLLECHGKNIPFYTVEFANQKIQKGTKIDEMPFS